MSHVTEGETEIGRNGLPKVVEPDWLSQAQTASLSDLISSVLNTHTRFNPGSSEREGR